MQITTNPAPTRAPALLLALLAAAGLALTGCGDDDSSPATPAPAPPAPPPAPEPPGTPGNLRVASTGSDFIEFSWDAVDGASGYEIEMSMTEGDFSQAMKATVEGTMHRFTVAAETTGYGRVRAMNDDGASGWSDAVMGMSMAAPLMLGTPMPRVSSTGPDHIEWEWDAVENALAYQVQVADSMDGLDAAEMEVITVTMHRVTAEPEMEMYIRVRAGAGTPTSPIVGDWSDAVMGMSAVAPLVAPTVTVSSTGSDYIEFSWEAVAGAAGYEIQMSMTEGDFSSVSTAMVEGTMHRFAVEPETTGYARVRAVEGDRQSAWSEPATGMSMAAPLVLAVPMPKVSSTGQDHIEWSWDAVENAEAYDVQVADSMAGLDDADRKKTTETKYRVTAEPETEMYIRVRAAAGAEPSRTTSNWSDAASGVSDAAPRPFVVSMRPPEAAADRTCGGQAFCPDRGTDAKTARASVNPKMLVASSHAARVTPMFVEGVSGVTVEAGEAETPFAYADGWDALQTTVAGDGVTFEFRQVTIGAGQEPLPTGEARYLTCGPFRCSEAADAAPAAPEITLADSDSCEGVEVDLELIKGVRFNAYQRVPDGGVDIGWQYTSTHPAKVTHEFDLGNAVMSVPGYDLEATSVKVWLDMLPHADAENPINKFGGDRNRDTTEFVGTTNYEPYARSAPWTGSLRTADDPGPIRNGPWDCLHPTSLGANDQAWEGWDYHAATRSFDSAVRDPVRRPRNCVRLVTDGLYLPYGWGRSNPEWHNYAPGYRVHVDPQGGVSWAGSRVTDWGKEHPFETLSCERITFPVADQLDLCGDFREEVNDWWGDGLKGADPPFRVEYESSWEFTSGWRAWHGRLTHIVIRPSRNVITDQQNQETYRPDGSRHLNLWLVRGGSGDAPDGTHRDANLYWQQSPSPPNDDAENNLHNLSRRAWGASRDWEVLPQWRAPMFIEIHDEDGDPQHGDIGKVDLFTGDTCLEGGSPNFGPCGDSRGSDGNPDNYGHANNGGPNPDADRCTDDDGGKGCDAVVDFDLSASFTRIRDTDSCVETIETSITCTWLADADGRMARTGTRGREASRRNWYDYDRNGRIQNDFIHCVPN